MMEVKKYMSIKEYVAAGSENLTKRDIFEMTGLIRKRYY